MTKCNNFELFQFQFMLFGPEILSYFAENAWVILKTQILVILSQTFEFCGKIPSKNA